MIHELTIVLGNLSQNMSNIMDLYLESPFIYIHTYIYIYIYIYINLFNTICLISPITVASK